MAKTVSEHPVRDIPIKDIDRSRNYRMKEPDDAAKLEALAESLKAAGQVHDIRVYERGPEQKDKDHRQPFILGFGARRCEALLMLGVTTVRAAVYPPADDIVIEQVRAIENLHRKDISPLEEVQAVSNLLDAIKRDKVFAGDPYEEAATRLARSVTWVKDRDYLHRLVPVVRDFVARAGLPAGHLREIAKIGDPEDQMRLACESAGAQLWPFKVAEGADGDGTAAKEARERFFAGLADGAVQRWPLSKLKQQVELLKRSLKVAPWEYQEPVEHDGVMLPACKACPHNSETDRTLFGLEAESDNPRGYCLNASCFEAKRQASEAVKVAVYKKVAGRKDQSPTAIRRVAPTWLKDGAVVGYVQRQLKKAAEGEPAAKSESAKPAREQAILQFGEAQERWQRKALELVLKGINADPVFRVGWCVLAGTAAFRNQGNWSVPRINVQIPEPCVEHPTLTPLPDKVKEAVALAMKGARQGWIELAGWTKQTHPDQWDAVGWLHPEALQLLAEAVGVKLTKMSEWKAPVAVDAAAPAEKG